jgi:hypothetical protein
MEVIEVEYIGHSNYSSIYLQFKKNCKSLHLSLPIPPTMAACPDGMAPHFYKGPAWGKGPQDMIDLAK